MSLQTLDRRHWHGPLRGWTTNSNKAIQRSSTQCIIKILGHAVRILDNRRCKTARYFPRAHLSDNSTDHRRYLLLVSINTICASIDLLTCPDSPPLWCFRNNLNLPTLRRHTKTIMGDTAQPSQSHASAALKATVSSTSSMSPIAAIKYTPQAEKLSFVAPEKDINGLRTAV
jgi:hypothetical protein